MKVKVRFSGWDSIYSERGSAVPRACPGEPSQAGRWRHPPRYEISGAEANDKVVPIWVEPSVPKAEVLTIRPAKSKEPEVVTPAELVHALTQMLNPASVLVLALAVWSFFADLGMANSFAIPDGAFSHWQTWVAVAGAIHLFNRSMQRRFAVPVEQARTDSSRDSAR